MHVRREKEKKNKYYVVVGICVYKRSTTSFLILKLVCWHGYLFLPIFFFWNYLCQHHLYQSRVYCLIIIKYSILRIRDEWPRSVRLFYALTCCTHLEVNAAKIRYTLFPIRICGPDLFRRASGLLVCWHTLYKPKRIIISWSKQSLLDSLA